MGISCKHAKIKRSDPHSLHKGTKWGPGGSHGLVQAWLLTLVISCPSANPCSEDGEQVNEKQGTSSWLLLLWWFAPVPLLAVGGYQTLHTASPESVRPLMSSCTTRLNPCQYTKTADAHTQYAVAKLFHCFISPLQSRTGGHKYQMHYAELQAFLPASACKDMYLHLSFFLSWRFPWLETFRLCIELKSHPVSCLYSPLIDPREPDLSTTNEIARGSLLVYPMPLILQTDKIQESFRAEDGLERAA